MHETASFESRHLRRVSNASMTLEGGLAEIEVTSKQRLIDTRLIKI